MRVRKREDMKAPPNDKKGTIIMMNFSYDDMNNENKDMNMNNSEQNKDSMNGSTVNAENTVNTANVTNAANADNGSVNAETNGNVQNPQNQNPQNAQNQNPGMNNAQGGSYSYTRGNIPGGTYSVNGNGNPYGMQNPQYQQNAQYQQNGQNPQNAQNQNGYGANQYGYRPYTNSYAPNQNGAQISYAPAKKKKERKPSNISRGAVAIAACLTVVFSGCFGFAGSYLANRVNGGSSDAAQTVNSGSTAVVYKSVDSAASNAGISLKPGEALSYSEVAAIVKDSVVEITTEYNVQNMWYNYVTQGAGSGVIISDDGYIITNNHVICDSTGSDLAEKITVRLTNGDEYDAQVIGHDSDSDIAVLKIEATGLTYAVAGNSDDLTVGEEVMIVGNPLGELGGTVTNGIVSATEREIQVESVTMTLIQTNAAVNPGNSGGGMFNMKGELVGIVNAKSSGTGIEGLGFAIPINDALRVNEQLLEYGYVRGKVMIGVGLQDVSSSSNFMYYYNLKPGVYVGSLTEGYNDDVLQVGDRIVAVNENEVNSSSDVKAIVKQSEVGDKLNFQVYRDGKLVSVEVTCYEKVPDNAGSGIDFSENTTDAQDSVNP